jgi:hypothetical protein
MRVPACWIERPALSSSVAAATTLIAHGAGQRDFVSGSVLVWRASSKIRSTLMSSQLRPKVRCVHSGKQRQLTKPPNEPRPQRPARHSKFHHRIGPRPTLDGLQPLGTSKARSPQAGQGIKSVRPRPTHHSANVRACLRRSCAAPILPCRIDDSDRCDIVASRQKPYVVSQQ